MEALVCCSPWAHKGSGTTEQLNNNNMSTESMMPSNHLILCCPLLLLPAVFPSIRVFSNESALHIRRPKYWSFSFSIYILFSCYRNRSQFLHCCRNRHSMSRKVLETLTSWVYLSGMASRKIIKSMKFLICTPLLW